MFPINLAVLAHEVPKCNQKTNKTNTKKIPKQTKNDVQCTRFVSKKNKIVHDINKYEMTQNIVFLLVCRYSECGHINTKNK